MLLLFSKIQKHLTTIDFMTGINKQKSMQKQSKLVLRAVWVIKDHNQSTLQSSCGPKRGVRLNKALLGKGWKQKRTKKKTLKVKNLSRRTT